jgi:hypothetical protein
MLICSIVSRASSSTSVEGTEVVRVLIGLGRLLTVFQQAFHPEPCEICITGKTQSAGENGRK